MDIPRPKRIMYAAIGILLVGLAGIGAVLPGIPTVGPLMLASYFLLKSSRSLEQRLVRNRFFAKYVGYLDGSTEMPMKTRVASIVMMWVSITLSGTMIYWLGPGQRWLLLVLGLAGVIGTIFIWRFRRTLREPDAGTSPGS